MQSFQCLLPNGVNASSSTSAIMKSFKTPSHKLDDLCFEKPLMEETLYSLGRNSELNWVKKFLCKIYCGNVGGQLYIGSVIEGLFRKCCEITLCELKDESKTLMSVLRPFVYDLGVINHLRFKPQSGLEITDPKAITDVKRIEERLRGYVKRTLGNSMPLSTEGQVNFLVNEAIDIDNLASMYIGWGSYI